MHLVVVQAFRPYGKGDTIADADAMAAVMASPNRVFVVPVVDGATEGTTVGSVSGAGTTTPPSSSTSSTPRAPVIVAAVDLAAGMPVTFSRAAGRLVPARSDTKFLSFTMGIMASACAAGFAASPATGVVTLADWTAATGAAALTQGLPYYLGAAGGLVTAPDPSAMACVVAVGVALSATDLMVQPATPLQL